MKMNLSWQERPFWMCFLFLFGLLTGGCQSPRQVNTGSCNLEGTVTDFSGLDGCQLLIVTATGEKLLPVATPEAGFALVAGQKIRFSYVELEGQMSICMAEDKIVRLTCLEPADANNRPAVPPCLEETRLAPDSWLDRLRLKHQASQITKYPYKTDGWAYLLKGKGYYLYDCQGTLIKTAAQATDCMKGEITRPKEGVIIFPAEKEKN